MSIVLLLALAPLALLVLALVPALAVQFSLGYWFRPAERLSVEEAWAVRFEELRSRPSAAFNG